MELVIEFMPALRAGIDVFLTAWAQWWGACSHITSPSLPQHRAREVGHDSVFLRGDSFIIEE